MSLVLGVVMDPIEHIKPWKDTTLALLLEARRRGWTLLYMEPGDLFLRDGRVRAMVRPLRVFDSHEAWFERDEAREYDPAEMDIILMRQDPPFNQEYLYTTYLLEKVERMGVLVSNRPASVRALVEAEGLDPERRGLAVARNGRVVPRGQWADTPLEPGDAIEIVKPFSGG